MRATNLESRTKAENSSSDEIRRIEASGLFDREWYLRTYPDVAQSGIDPIEHYLIAGAQEGRDPGPLFDTIYYLSENPPVQAAGYNPLLFFIDSGEREMCRAVPLTQAQRFESFCRSVKTGALEGDKLQGWFDQIHYGLLEPQGTRDPGGLPLPPLDLSIRVGSPNLYEFDIAGRNARQTLLRCLPPQFTFQGARCLDFGCGIGRVIRHFHAEAEVSEFWGCDIDGTSIRWNAENLSPPFSFFQLSDAPVLPLESSSFDFVYALGVFNQLYDNWQAFAMEIRRILKPDGTFFMSFNAQTPFEEMFESSYEELIRDTGMLIRNPFNGWGNGGPTLVHSPTWIQKHWGPLFEIDYFAMEGLLDSGSICMMRKPFPGARRRHAAPILRLATSQEFNRDARGKIIGKPDPSRPYLDSFGVEGRGITDIEGWIVFRRDVAKEADLYVDGPGRSYRGHQMRVIP